ncbi:MAG: hypothetical protein AB7F43_01930 [Bacteriovoracia bacterium]
MEDKERRDYLERHYVTNAFSQIPDPRFQIFLENLFGGVRRRIKGLLGLWAELDENHRKTLKGFKGKGLL